MCGEAFQDKVLLVIPTPNSYLPLRIGPWLQPKSKLNTNSVESKYPRAMLVAEVNAPSLKTTYIVKKYIYKKNYFQLLCSFLQSEMGFILKA